MIHRKTISRRWNILAILCLLTYSLNAQDDDFLIKQSAFLNIFKESFEGFQTSECENIISYHSLRNDITDGLLTRATDGSMGIEWKTQAIPDDHQSDGAWFVWLAAIDITDIKVNFDLFIDGVKRFNFQSGTEKSWTLTHPEGGILQYHSFDSDQNGDSHGYMTMYAPKEWLKPGKPLSINILGEAAGQNTWVIVFKAADIIDYLGKSTEFQVWLDVSIREDQKQYSVVVTAPANLAGKELSYISGEQKGNIELEEKEGVSKAQFSLEGDIKNHRFIVSDDHCELLVLDHLKKDTIVRKLLTKAVIINELTVNNGQFNVKCRRLYKPKTAKSILALNRSKLNKGKIYLMNSSHQDIAWMDSPEKCILERDTMLITPLIEQAKANPYYRFDIEDALMIKEYTQRHPDKKETIRQLFKDGKISCGSGYSQPYEEMYSGEALIRQFYFGRKWLKDEFGYDANTYWNVDVPGRTLQMPQILKKSGTPYMMISRHEKGIFNWYSPDSSFVTAYSPGHYSEAYTPLHKDFYTAAEYLAFSSMEWEKYYSHASQETVIPLLSDWDMSPANDYSHIIKQWESISELTDENGLKTNINLPQFKIVTTPELFESFLDAANPLPSISGERPALWLYIHGPGHQKALKASREGDILLTMAEKFATIDALTGQSFKNYPAIRLQKAWEAKIYPDHGWGGKNGIITDNLFRRKFEFARNEAEQILEIASRSISSKIKSDLKKGIPVVVFNSLSWERTDIVDFEINFDEGEARSVYVNDAAGNNMPVQCQVAKQYPDGTIQSAKVTLVAKNIPSIGYQTYYIQASEKIMRSQKEHALENEYYKISFTDGGLNSIYDKSLRKEIVDDSKFVAGEVFTMQSVGNGAGEFDKIQQPSMEGFDQTGNHSGDWETEESGDIFSSWVKRSKLPHAVVEQEIILYHAIKRVDFKVALLNWEGELFREFRMALPLKMDEGEVAYEVPFGVVEVGKDEMEGAAGERYNVPAKDLHPRGIENWIGASDHSVGVTLSSSVAVADYMDPSDDPVSYPILQPVLLASRVSCHGEGNMYLQTGNHYYCFSLNSHQSGWESGFRFGKQANEKMFAVVNPETYKSASLPESQSFFSIEAENLVISTIKRAEEDNSIIVRVYDTEGKATESVLKTSGPIKTAMQTNLIEEPIQHVEVSKTGVTLNIGHHQIETFKISIK
ncbi:MAG: glycosyl hydrolase-related protein [Bacteroidota bacterium]